MHASIAKKLAKKMKRQAGFTLLEILVVLTIMGFLIAMVAPRLAGISGDAVDTVCDSNQNRMVSMMSGYFEKTSRFPNKLTNLVEEIGANTYQLPAVSDDDPDNGPETLASEFMDRNHFRMHYLNAREAAELKTLGIVSVLNLNAYDAMDDDNGAVKSGFTQADDLGYTYVAANARNASMDSVLIDSGIAVAMVGMGAEDNADDPTFDVHTDERNWGEPDWFGRIVLGFGPENGLVTSGIVANAAHCPGGIQNTDNVTYNDYNIVLPRLEATAERIETGTLTDFTATPSKLVAVAYDDEPAADYVIATNGDNLKVRTFDITTAQPKWQYATQCPEGHMFPADDEEFWGIDIAGTVGNID
ncbi:prepilin-type N-terminal cleavage/methylation domain-containing protein [Desulfomicrobium macestii]|uniref:Prepilin-type N-terminal cleavage/methylation domain-containing protein n=1 Tax=Desulfomicrobium macestii TaxID=90731 RepID=A0ABR9H672_9BACT|nr:prepilin-type N-terminal cleavage/methylation domain-containing protein [Desulfomicrobium macestii]MBE1426216.1 prepilin-type N-terminal cleavage/methylation domain-containing protein [Desulfomicrobium macestii]